MHRKYFFALVITALACVLLVVISMWRDTHTFVTEPKIEMAQPPLSPFKSYISAVGIVEASSENVYIGTPISRIIESVEVTVGERVKKGDVLFRLESRDLKADLFTRSIAYENAVVELQKLEALPRTEDVVSAEAVLKNAQVELSQAKSQYEMIEGLQNTGAISKEEVNRRRFNYEQMEAKVQQMQANLDKIKAGTWLPDLEIARLQVLQAKSYVQRVEADIERTIIRAPMDGTVLQIKIHPGELSPSDPSRIPPMILGNTDTLYLRVSINQFDASYYRSDASAVAFLQGNAQVKFPLQFVQLEPYFVAKQNLTNDIKEKVDTRVLQVIYSFKANDQRIFVGQQMDVFIENE